MVFEANAGGAASLGGTYRSCSYNKTTMTAATSTVAPVLQIPCSGTSTSGNAYSAAGTCQFGDFGGWADMALQQAAASGINVNNYFYKLIIVPEGTSCSWAGVGYVGCDGSFSCNSWVRGGYFMGSARGSGGSAQVAAHEQGHNMYLHHASSVATAATAWSAATTADEYGDWSCSMGYCCATRCANTPHAYQMGWITPQLLDATSLAEGQTRTVSFAAQTRSAASGLKISPSWAAVTDPLYLGYRMAEGFDASLPSNFANRVNIYTWAGATNTDSVFTYW